MGQIRFFTTLDYIKYVKMEQLSNSNEKIVLKKHAGQEIEIKTQVIKPMIYLVLLQISIISTKLIFGINELCFMQM